MAGKIIALLPKQKIKQGSILVNSIIAHALYACQDKNLNSFKKEDLRPMPEKLLLRCWSFTPANLESDATLIQMSMVWDIDVKKLQKVPLTLEISEKENVQLTKLKNRLNSDSRSRKQAQEEVNDLSEKLFLSLIKKLSESRVIELQQLANDLIYNRRKSTDAEPLFNLLKNNPCRMFSATHLYFIKNDEDWRFWNRRFQKHLSDRQSPNGSWDNKSLIVPMNKKDKIFFNSCYAVLNLTIFYCHLKLFKKRNKPPLIRVSTMPEEGLDLEDCSEL